MALVDLRSSEDLTARCSGVRPFESIAFTSASHATMQLRASSAPAKAAQWRGVLSLLSFEFMFKPYLMKKARDDGQSPCAAT